MCADVLHIGYDAEHVIGRIGKCFNSDIDLAGKEVDLLIGNDSGNLHMASSVNTPVIGLYGPMPFEKWSAIGENNILLKADLPCMPCSLKGECKHNKACMNSITIEQVKETIDKLLK